MPSTIDHLELKDGICQFRPRGESSLVEAVDLIGSAIAHCRRERLGKLLVNATALVGVRIPSLVDRFLMAEEWAQEANSMVAVALVVHPEYIHPEKFGVVVAARFGLTLEVDASEINALAWLASVG